MPGLEDMSDSDSEDEGSDNDSDIDDTVDAPTMARLVERLQHLSLPQTTPPLSPSSRAASSDPSYIPSSPSSCSSDTGSSTSDEEFGRLLSDSEFHAIHQQLNSVPVVESFPKELGTPGAAVSSNHQHAYERDQDALDGDARSIPWTPFISEIDWEVARWAKLRGPSSTALTELLKIPQVLWIRTLSSHTSILIFF